VDPRDGAALVVGGQAFGLLRIDRYTGAQELMAAGFADARGVVADRWGCIAALDADPSTPAVVRIDSETGEVTSRVDLPTDPRGIALEPSGDVVLACYGYGDQARIVRVARTSDQQSVVAVGYLLSQRAGGPDGVAIDGAGTILALAHMVGFVGTSGMVVQVDPQTGEQSVVTIRDELTGHRIAAVTADGTVLISTIETLFRLNEAGPPTPVRAVVSGLAVVPPLPDRRS
jgi:sugar lactone lactonase YvrE